MKDLKIILKMFWDVIAGFFVGLFISDKESDFVSHNLKFEQERAEIELKNKAYLKKYSGKNRYVKCPAVN